MMNIADREKYQRHREARAVRPGNSTALHELALPMLLFGSMGAITWAIRGSNGWGGIDGTIIPGMTWGLLWYYLCHRKGIDGRGIPLWLGMGIAVGGELGYGQYVSWIRGLFNVGDEIIPIAPWIGHAWFVIAGIGWGAFGGVALGWVLSEKATLGRWLVRLLVPVCAAFLGWLLVHELSWLFFPNYGLGVYAGELGHHLTRTVHTNTHNITVVAWWVGALLVAVFQKDRATLAMGALIGGGFGIGFPLGALWCLRYAYTPITIDWWKVWELNAGFNLGLLYVLALYWATWQVDKSHDPSGVPLDTSTAPKTVPHRLRRLSLTSALFLLLFFAFRGVSSRAGVLLGFYDMEAVNGYEWPLARIALFTPVAAVLVAVTAVNIWRIMRSPETSTQSDFGLAYLPERMGDLMTGLAVIGAVTIWPQKIGVLYAVFLFFAIFAFNRLNRRFDEIDAADARSGGSHKFHETWR